MLKPSLALAAVLLAGGAWGAEGCDTLRTQIEAKIRAAGVMQFSLVVVDAGAAAAGKTVGSCDRGAKKIVYAQSAAAGASSPPRPAPARPTRAPILTECRDGSVSVGGDCKR